MQLGEISQSGNVGNVHFDINTPTVHLGFSTFKKRLSEMKPVKMKKRHTHASPEIAKVVKVAISKKPTATEKRMLKANKS